MMRLRRRRCDASDDGNISLLTLGFLVVAMLTLLVVAAATAVHIQRLRLVHLADEAAADAADSLDLAQYYEGDAPLPTDDAAVNLARSRMEEAVVRHVESRGDDQLEGVRIVSVVTPDGSTAVVTLSLVVHPLFALEPLMPFANGIEIRATGSARNF